MALIFALLAILLQPIPPPPDFIAAIVRCELATFEPGTFIGCTTHDADEDLYAGLIWIDGAPSYQTGP